MLACNIESNKIHQSFLWISFSRLYNFRFKIHTNPNLQYFRVPIFTNLQPTSFSPLYTQFLQNKAKNTILFSSIIQTLLYRVNKFYIFFLILPKRKVKNISSFQGFIPTGQDSPLFAITNVLKSKGPSNKLIKLL